jgi:hypothetical protein
MASGFVVLIFGVGAIVGMALGSSIESGWSPWLVLQASRFAACLGALVLFVGNGNSHLLLEMIAKLISQ